MNYQKIHDDLISRAKSENRKKVKGGVYYENHHIIPVCLGGDNSKQNMVLLTGREHFIVHKLLHSIHPQNKSIWFAMAMMTGMNGGGRGYKVSSREYDRIMADLGKRMSDLNMGRESWNKGMTMSEEFCKKDSESCMGRTPWNKGGKISDKTRIKMKEKVWENDEVIASIKLKNSLKIVSDETRKKLSLANKGYVPSREAREKISKALKGRITPYHVRVKIGEKQKGKIIPKYQIEKRTNSFMKRPLKKCPYCDVVGRGAGIARYHFDNCKMNPNYTPKAETTLIIICPHCGTEGKNKGAMSLWHFNNCKKFEI